MQWDSGDQDRGLRFGTGGVEADENNLKERVVYQWRVRAVGVVAAEA